MAGEFDRNNIKNTNKICNFTKEYLSNYSDEYYTSDEQVKDMIERVELDKSWNILCPFDTVESEFVIYLKKNNYNVTYLQPGEINTDYDPSKFDIVITNPPWRDFTKLYSEYFDSCPRFITVLSWSIIWNIEKNYNRALTNLRSFAKDKYRSSANRIKFNATNSDNNIDCFYLYKGFTEGTDIQHVKVLKYEKKVK